MNPTNWAMIENYENDAVYAADPPRKGRHTMSDPMDFLMDDDPEHEPEDDDPPFFTARYNGMCGGCGEYHIIEGVTQIRADGSDGWEAEECA